MNRYETYQKLASSAHTAALSVLGNVAPSSEALNASYRPPEQFTHDFGTVRLLLIDAFPDCRDVLWTVRIDGIGWTVWVRDLDAYGTAYATSRFNCVTEEQIRDMNDVFVLEAWERKFVVEVNIHDNRNWDRGAQRAKEWFDKYQGTIGFLYRNYLDTRVSRGIKSFFR